jgi:uncharacterized membrane protein
MAMSETTEADGAATGGVRTLLRLEGLALFAVMVGLYPVLGGRWWLFAMLFLAPDLSFAAYLAGPRVGALVYNAAHSTLAPFTLLSFVFVLGDPTTALIAMIWLAHIGFDRALGYGLKYQSGFTFTHLGRIGKGAKTA